MNRLALVGIIVENPAASARINDILHEYASYVVGRMGIPYRSRGVSVISIVIDAPEEITNSLAGKLGMVSGASSKTMFAKA